MIDFAQIKADAIGRWPGIYEKFGIDVGNGKHKSCPVCGGKDRFRFDDMDGRGTALCSQCGSGEGFQWLQRVLGIDKQESYHEVAKIVGTIEPSKYQKEKPVSPDMLRKMFKESKPLKYGDPVYKYLQNRGLQSFPPKLRYMAKCWEPETKQDQKAMLAVFHLTDGTAVTMQRTYLDGKGGKLDIDSPKKTMPPLRLMKGGAVRLYEYESGVLGVAEGIETAIAIHENYKWPVWATLSTFLMAGFVPPKNVSAIVVFADNDSNFAGQKAAYVLANRLKTENNNIKTVSVEVPENVGEDFLNEINRTKG